MDRHARVSKDLLEPGPTFIELQEATGDIVKNGLTCSCDLKMDYSTINNLESSTGQQLVQQLTYLEAIPPPYRDCIQLHRLEKGQNMAHLLVLYHHFGASTVVFINTSDSYDLQPELMATLAVAKKNPPRGIKCILISRENGEKLIKKIDDCSHNVYCWINSSNVADDLHIVPDHYTAAAAAAHKSKFGGLSRHKSRGYVEEAMKKILKLVSNDAAISQQDFQVIMRKCEEIEGPGARMDGLMTVDDLLVLLLQPSRFGRWFQCDYLLYIALAHRIEATLNDTYVCNYEELLKIFCRVCIEGLCDTQDIMLHSLDSLKKNVFQTLFMGKLYNICDLLGDAFSNLCRLWVKDKKNTIPPRYWDVAMLCITFTQKLFTNPKDHKMWKRHIANTKISSKLSLEDEDFYYLQKGMEYMANLQVARQYAFTPAHFTDFLLESRPKIRPLICMKRLIFYFSKMDTEFWENHLKYFLVETAEMYHSVLSSKQPKYAAITELEGIYGVFVEGWYFVVKTIEILEDRNCYNNLTEECSRWMNVLLFVIDFSSADGLQCITFFVDGINYLPENLVTHCIKELNKKFSDCCTCNKLPVEQFQPIFSAASFWKPKILQCYLQSYAPQPNIVICNDRWQQLLQAASDSPPKIVVDLLRKTSKQYKVSKRSESFIVDLVSLDTPKLLLGCESKVSSEFTENLRIYIKICKLRESLIQKYIHIIESTSLQENFFMMLVVSATMEEVFLEVKKEEYQVFQDIIVSAVFQQLDDLLKAANYTSVRAKCVFGTLQKISSHVCVAKEDLDWLKDTNHVKLLIVLCQCYQVVCKHASHSDGDLDADISEFLEKVKSREVEEFITFCEGLQSTLRTWKKKVTNQTVIIDDIENLKKKWKWFNYMCDAALVSSACIDESEVDMLAVTYEEIETQLTDILLQQIPSHSNRCYLPNVLTKLAVALPFFIEKKIENIVISSAILGIKSFPASSKLELNKQAMIPELNDLLTHLLNFIQPLAENLKAVVFFHLNDSRMFFSYTAHFMVKVIEKQPVSPTQKWTTTRMPVRDDHSKHIDYAAASVKSTLFLLNNMCLGTATYNEVTLNGDIVLLDTETVDTEIRLFVSFAISNLSQNLFGTTDGLHGLLCFAELDAINKYIGIITDVLRQFKLQVCLESDEYNVLLEAETVLADKGNMSLNTARETLDKLKVALHLESGSQSDLTCFRIFESVRRCANFYRFAEKSKFTGPTGKRSFIDQYRIVQAQVQHEDFNQAILHHLYGSYDYIAPFFNTLVTFSQLITAIMRLKHLDKGIEHLETVSQNIVLIEMWFRKVEGETTENIEKTLKSIQDSGMCTFFTCNGGNSVEFQLVYNPYCQSNRRSYITESAALVESEYEKWSLEQMNEFALKLGFIQCEQQGFENLKKNVMYYQRVFKLSVDLLYSYRELKALGHPDYQLIDTKLRSTLIANALENEVEKAKAVLEKWKSDTEKYRETHIELAFFSNEKVMRILRIIQEKQPADNLVKEIDFLFECDSGITRILTEIVETHLQLLNNTYSCSKLPVEIVGLFLHEVVTERSDQEPVSILSSLSSKKMERSLQIDSKFKLHSVHDFTPEQVLQLIFTVFRGVPKSFQLLKCSTSTTRQQLELFFNRIVQWQGMQYLIIGVDCLSNEMQEMLVQKCSELESDDETKVDFIECCQSVLRLMPSVSIHEHKDTSGLSDYSIIHESMKEAGLLKRCLKIYLVSGLSGDGKTHYIQKEMGTRFSECAIFSLNESFDACHVIKQLQSLSAKPGVKTALHLNFTFVLPASSESTEEKEQYRFTADQISWFLTNLFLFGYVEDACTGVSFRLPSDAEWTVFVEIPCIDNTVHHSLETFVTTYPAFKMLGEVEMIEPSQPYDIDHRTQLVCKYLKAKKEDKLNQLAQQRKGKLIEVKIGKVSDLTDEECRQLLDEFMPKHVDRKITKKLYLRYMFRRCHFLEESPFLKFNVGSGILKRGQQGQQQATDTSKLRSVLFETMLDEVSDFCQQYDQRKSHYHQLVYDFRKEGDGSFSLLSEAPDGCKMTEEQEKFVDFGFDLPSPLQLRKRKKLDKLVSMALGVPYNETTEHIDLLDKKEYVMTLDYAVKMLTIHERRLCGVPVVIKGESGVGKTFLLETLSSLWNYALLADLELERSRLRDLLNKDLSEAVNSASHSLASRAKEIDDALNNISDEVISITTLTFIMNLKPSNSQKYHEKLRLLRTTSVLSILELPSCTEAVESYSELFIKAENASKSKSKEELLKATAQLLYCILYGKLPGTFHKISVNAALMPSDITKLFQPILEQANLILERSRRLWGTNSMMDELKLPVVTVFLDEINTSSCLGVLKEIVIDGTLDGKEIPHNVFIVAACNPYRGDSLASLKSDSWFRGSYYVRPLHPTLELLMWDYKALDHNQEREYVFAKMSLNKSQFTQSIMNTNSDNVDNSSLTDQIVKSQDLVRKYAYESLIERMKKSRSIEELTSADKEEARVCASSTVSQRDIQRVFRFYSWLQNMFATTKRYAKESKIKVNLRAVYVSMALVYYFRLDSECRAKYLKEMNKSPVFTLDKEPITFSDALQNELDWLIENISLPEGVAPTEALKENLYSIVVCTMTRTPLIILGPPGSSKTLSFKIIISNLQGMASVNGVFRESDVFHALEPTFYQCSRRSTSTEIDSKFETAMKNQKFYDSHGQNSYSVVIMDEAGLPEESHESLKVLHVHLDRMAVSFVAISNHVLDAAKTNRAVSLFRPETSKEDVIKLAEGCLKEKFSFTEGICEVYLSKMKNPEFRAFYGLRDFIHFCTFLHHYNIKSPQTVFKALERNFNGSSHFKDISEYFLQTMSSSLAQVEQRSVLAILRDSLLDKRKDLSAENEVRYKLIIDSSEDESIIRFLFTYGILQRDKTRLYICSKFPGDGEAQKINTIAAIRHSAVLGHTVILSQTDEIHETFYDLFNQRFTCIDHPEHGKLYFTNIAIGPHVKPSKVDPHFQCVVVIKKSEQDCTPAPFLNRFEKYALSHHVLLQDVLDSYPKQLRLLINAAIDKVGKFVNVFGVSGLYGQNESTLQSLLLTVLPVYSSDHEFTFSETTINSKERLLRCLLGVAKGRLNLSFPNVTASLSSAAEYVAGVLVNDCDFSGTLSNLSEKPISSSIIDEAVDYLVNKGDASTTLTVDCKMVIAFLLQWLITYLCERLMQLVTPEALIINHKKIPSYYMNVYLNQQHHFKLKELIVDFHSALLCKDTIRSVPNKLLCFSRSSSLIHSSIFDEFPIEGKSAEGLERLVFSYPEVEEDRVRDLDLRLRVTKVTNSTTQNSITNKLELFCKSETLEVMVFVINMQHFSVKIVNHLRIMIEEAEVLYLKAKDVPKLFVVFLHFPPEMFFSHCYPSLFLLGWDHYYLDTIAPSEENAVIDISQWFSYFCISENSSSEQSNFLLEPLRQLMEKAIPVLATRFSLTKNKQMPDLDQHKVNLKDLEAILLKTELGTVLQKQFASYWQAAEMAEFSEQAANFPHMYESTLSITDAIHTIVRSSFYDYLFYILSVLKKQSVLVPFLEADKSGFKDISLELIEHFPKPRTLSHLKIASMSVVRVSKEQLKTTKFPFFHFICGLLKNLLDQCEKDVQTDESDLESSMDSQPMSLGLRQSANSSPIEALCYKAEKKLLEASMAGDQHFNQNLSQKEDLKFLQFALKIMGQDPKRWTAYFDDFMAIKFNLDTYSNSPSVLMLRKLFSQLDDIEIRRRAVELHAYIKLNRFDSIFLELLRYVDNLYQDATVFFPAANEALAMKYFEQLNLLSKVVLNSLYDSLSKFSEPDRVSVPALKNLSEYFYTLISNPEIKKVIDDIPCHEKAMLQVLYATFLMLFSKVENTAESTMTLFGKLNVLLSTKDNESKLTLEEVVITVAQTIVDTNASVDTIVEVLTLPYNPSFHYMLEGVFEYFLCTPSDTDLEWFLKLANSSAVVETMISSQRRMTLSAHDVRHHLLTLLITLQDPDSSSDDTLEKIFSSKLCGTLETFLSSCVPKSDTGELVCVPVHYHVRNPIERSCPLLLHLYCNLLLQVLRNRNMSLQDIIRLYGQISSGTMGSKGVILKTAEQQATVQYLIEKLSQLLTAKENNIVLLSEICDDANHMLGNAGDGLEGHGLMLALQLLRDYSSSRVFIESMVAKNGDYTDFECLLPIHRSLTEKEVPTRHIPSLREPFPPSLKDYFPFNMMSGNKTDEQVLYGRIKKVLTSLHRAPKKEAHSNALQRLIGECYGEGALIKSGRKKKHIFNMLMWLCIYYDFFCREKSCSVFASALKDNFSQYKVEPTFLALILMFANSQQASWNQLPLVANPKTIGELFRSKDVDNVELRDTLAHLVAAVLGSCEKPCHLNHHLFSPQELLKTLIPGAMIQVAIGGDNPYDKVTKLVEGSLPGLQHVASMKTHTMSLQCYYFTLWTNYGALCVNQLLNNANGLLEKVFSQNVSPLQYSFERMVQLWNMLSTHFCLTTENRFILVCNVLEGVYKRDFENNQIVSCKILDEYQKEWNEVFVNGWVASKEQELLKPVLPHPIIGEKISQLDRRSPVFASIPRFLLQLFSSTYLDNQSCRLYVLYQFILKRPKLNAGGMLLPGLVRVYWWLHNELNYTLSLDVAKTVTVDDMREYLERKCQDKQRKEFIELINEVKVKYQEYREIECCSKLPELTFETPLIDLLSTPDGHGILYKVMVHIVDSYNSFLKDVKEHGDTMLVERYMKEDFSNKSLIVSLAEVNESTCCFGSAMRLDDLDDVLPLISKCCSMVAFRQINGPLVTVDSTLLPCCVPQQFDMICLQDDIAKSFLAGKRLVQMPEGIHVMFQFKEESRGQPITGYFSQGALFQMAALENLEHELKKPLDEKVKRKTEYECHSMKYYTLLEVTIGLRNAVGYLVKDGFQISKDMETLSNLVKNIAETGSLSDLGIQPTSLTSSQSHFLLEMKLIHVYKTLELLLEWLELGMYDFCSLPFAMKAHLTNEDKCALADIVHKHVAEDGGQVLQDLKSLQTVLVQADSKLRKSAVNEEINAPLNQVLCRKDCQLFKTYLPNGVLVCHYVHLRLELRRLFKEVQNNSDVEIPSEMLSDDEKWNDWVDDIWSKLKCNATAFENSANTNGNGHGNYGFEEWIDITLDDNLLSLKKEREESKPDEKQDEDETVKSEDAEVTEDEQSINLESIEFQERLDEKALIAIARKHSPAELASFLGTIGLECYAENVIDSEVSGDMLVGPTGMSVLKELDMGAIEQLRCHSLYHRHLSGRRSRLAEQCPVEKVVQFFEDRRVLRDKASLIKQYKIDGEMLLQASEEAIEELGITSIGWKLITKDLRNYSCS